MTVATDTLHVTRLVLAAASSYVQRDLRDPAEMHRTVMRGFPPSRSATPRADHGVLFRVDYTLAGPVLTVQSRTEPDWVRLPSSYVRDERRAVCDRDAIRDGDVLKFALVANPTRKVRSSRDGALLRNSRRVAITDPGEQLAWLARHLPGASVSAAAAIPRPVWRGRSVIVAPVAYRGRLVVDDRDALWQAIREGVGPARAYGCGLLTLRAP